MYQSSNHRPLSQVITPDNIPEELSFPEQGIETLMSMVHRAGEPGTYFPNYPYSKGGGHFRGSFHGYLACDMENKAMKFLNRKYNQMGERESRRINRHQYYSDPNDHNLPDDSQHGYCYNNLDPINH